MPTHASSKLLVVGSRKVASTVRGSCSAASRCFFFLAIDAYVDGLRPRALTKHPADHFRSDSRDIVGELFIVTAVEKLTEIADGVGLPRHLEIRLSENDGQLIRADTLRSFHPA